MKKINLAIIDDHNLFRKGLIKLINLGDKDGRYVILFEANNGIELKEKLDKRILPDIILMDIDMPDMDGFEAVEWLKDYFPSINVLVVSMFETEETILKMLRLGVKGYLSKDIEVDDMHLALETISNKGYYYSDIVTEVMANEVQNKHTGSTIIDKLNENETRFLTLVCTEMTYAQIAEKMCLSPKTIEGYRDGLCKKLQLTTRVGLALFAVKSGLVKL